MAKIEDRLIELEIRHTHQSKLLDDLSSELYKANEEIERLQQRIKRVEKIAIDLLNREELPLDEKPPHY